MPRTRAELIEASEMGDIEMVKKCITAGVDVNLPPRDGYNSQTALQAAIINGHFTIVQYLVAHGAQLDITDSNDDTAVELAQNYENADITTFLQNVERVQNTPEWMLFGASKLIHTEFSPAACLQLTEIFNMESRERLIITANLLTEEEAMTSLVSFDALPQPLVEKVLAQFSRLGGKADDGFVRNGTPDLKKPSFPLAPPR